jgi:hypothetical protein
VALRATTETPHNFFSKSACEVERFGLSPTASLYHYFFFPRGVSSHFKKNSDIRMSRFAIVRILRGINDEDSSAHRMDGNSSHPLGAM